MVGKNIPLRSIFFLAFYHAFTKKHGDLFTKRMEAMTDVDLVPVIKNDRFTRKITFPLFISVALFAFCGSIYLFIQTDWIFAIGFLLGSVAFIAFAYYLRSYYAELLRLKEKVVITGIVFRKRKFNNSDLISVSDQVEVFVEEKDAKRLKLGDMVEIECLSLERYIKNTVSIKGSIKDLLN